MLQGNCSSLNLVSKKLLLILFFILDFLFLSSSYLLCWSISFKSWLLHFLHPLFRWTGSNTNPNNNDGQGKAGTDRSNVLLLNSDEWGRNYPTLLDKTNFLGLDRDSLHNMALLDKSKLSITIRL